MSKPDRTDTAASPKPIWPDRQTKADHGCDEGDGSDNQKSSSPFRKSACIQQPNSCSTEPKSADHSWIKLAFREQRGHAIILPMVVSAFETRISLIGTGVLPSVPQPMPPCPSFHINDDRWERGDKCSRNPCVWRMHDDGGNENSGNCEHHYGSEYPQRIACSLGLRSFAHAVILATEATGARVQRALISAA